MSDKKKEKESYGQKDKMGTPFRRREQVTLPGMEKAGKVMLQREVEAKV